MEPLIDKACVLFCAQAQRAGAALKKGEKRVRAFGGVYAFPVQNRQLLEVGVRGMRWHYFCRVLAILSVHRRHHKPPLRGGRASGRRGQSAGSSAPDRAAKK